MLDKCTHCVYNIRGLRIANIKERKAMTANEIFEIMKEAYENSDNELEYFGLRFSSEEFNVGDHLENSHQWYQDDPADWGEECEYNEKLGLWDGGELNGVCTVGLPDCYQWDYDDTITNIDRAIKCALGYKYGDHTNCYLIGGNNAEGGNDPMELIISNAVVISKI